MEICEEANDRDLSLSLSLSLPVFGGENAIWSWTERNETDVNRRAETKRHRSSDLQTTLGTGFNTSRDPTSESIDCSRLGMNVQCTIQSVLLYIELES